MENQVKQIAERIHGLRILEDLTVEEMAAATDVTVEEFLQCEAGESDFSFTFLLKCAQRFEVDLAELVVGETPHLSFYTVVRRGQGVPIKRRAGFEYQHLGAFLKDRRAEPFLVTAPYSEAEQTRPIPLSTHQGQELDYILSGTLKVVLDGHTEVLQPGDSVFYNSAHGHGMIAIGGEDCQFLAVVLPPHEEKER